MTVKIYKILKREVDGSFDKTLLIEQSFPEPWLAGGFIMHHVHKFLDGASSWGQVPDFIVEVLE